MACHFQYCNNSFWKNLNILFQAVLFSEISEGIISLWGLWMHHKRLSLWDNKTVNLNLLFPCILSINVHVIINIISWRNWWLLKNCFMRRIKWYAWNILWVYVYWINTQKSELNRKFVKFKMYISQNSTKNWILYHNTISTEIRVESNPSHHW